ncbi:hypothetical protein GOBAR_DD02511 [Gossypium barbadense]|nr:hypothetical protein GOBAR_DD02511 [Gossypium barbadense]
MEDAMANIKLLDDEEEEIQEVVGAENFVYQFFLVGRCLTDSVVHFPSLHNTMGDLWHPIGGICITELGEKRVTAGTPWFFNNHLLILQSIAEGENPAVMELKFTEFWLQVHDLLPGSMNDSMAKQFGNVCGKFIEYDTSIPTLGIQTFLRTRVCLDVTAPLKCKKKVQFGKSLVVYARFKYEKLSLFCFICGRLGHGESFCLLRLQVEPSKIIFGWDLSLHAAVRHRNMAESRWDDKMVTDGAGYGSMDLVSNEEEDPIALLEGKKRGRITELHDDNGRQANSTEEFVQIASNYFGKLFSTSDVGSDECLFRLVEEKVTESTNEELLKEFTEEEITQADIWNALMVQVPPFESSLDHKELFLRAFLEADDRHKKIIAISLWSLYGFERELSLNSENIRPVTGSAGKEIWRPPDDGFIKINFDASFVQDKGLAITAVLARNHKGEVVGAETYLLNDVADPFVAEARASSVMVFAHTMGFQRLVVEGDALSVIKNISNGEAGKSIIRPIIYHIQQLARIFEEITYTFVPREGNEAAHVLAIEGRRKGDCRNWASDVPDLVLTAVRKDWIAWVRKSQDK